MQCPQCNSEMHANSAGLVNCSNCGYVQPVYHSVDEKIAEAAPLVAAPIDQRGFNFRDRRFLFACAVVFVLLLGFMGFMQVRASILLTNAQTLNQQHDYNHAYDLLKQAASLWAFPPTKQAINDSLDQTGRWQTYQDNITQATTLLREGKYDQAITLLQAVESDYPDYQSAKDLLASAEHSQGGILVERGATLPEAGQTSTPIPPSIPSSSPQPTASQSSPVAVAPKSSSRSSSSAPPPSAPSSPAPPPSYIISNSYCTVDTRQATDLYQVAVNMSNTCQSVFPQIVQRLSSAITAAPHYITLTDSGFSNGAVAYTDTAAGTIKVSISYMRSQPSDMGLVAHELTHVVQGYVNVNVPGWIVEGMADYMRYTLGYANSWSYFHCASSERYTSGYGCGASLLKYVERVYMPSVVKDLHNTVRQNRYTDAFFTGNTGKTPDQLYAECRSAECQGGAP